MKVLRTMLTIRSGRGRIGLPLTALHDLTENRLHAEQANEVGSSVVALRIRSEEI